MIRKLTRLIVISRIGRKSMQVSILMLFLSGCWQDNPDNYYQVYVRNDTADTLLLLLGKDDAVYNELLNYKIKPYRDTTLDWHGVIGLNNDEDPVRCVFSEGHTQFQDQARIYRHDSLKAAWEGPGREMPDSVHHFYNYNSWESWLLEEKQIDGATGIVMFTIYESDLEN
ncbi:MAG: hypothetical protein K9H26_00255 [Prolixibacteraceae bacterium]|nr:hypothetical protein [Prolixibacteraceae bacterium]